MQRRITLWFLVLLAQALIACSPSKDSGFTGYLYFPNGSYLMLFSLRDGSYSVVTSYGSRTINGISTFGEGRLLLTESEFVNRKEINRISWLDVKTGQKSTLYRGFLARYFADSGLMIYDDGRRLFVVDQAGDLSSEIILTHKMSQVSDLMAISGDTVLFETQSEGVRSISSYHLATGEIKTLEKLSGICRLKHAVWIDSLAQMACKRQPYETFGGDYILTSLEGSSSGSLPLPEDKRFNALTYVADQNALILTETWTSTFSEEEKSAVWIHNLKSGTTQRLAGNINLGSSVVYTVF